MNVWWRRKPDPHVKTPAELQATTDEIVAAFKAESVRAKKITSIISDRVNALGAHRGT